MMNNISKINLKGTSYDIKDKLVRNSIGVASSETSLGIAPLDASGKVPSENLPTIPQLPDLSNGHEYVDLGLPSGTLWATMNVGATSETDYGNYYMYGMGSKTYDSADSPYSGTEDPLDLSKDTARVVWGGDWHMPTKAQMEELIANTTYQWVEDYQGSGINGGLFTAQNGNSVFFPPAGSWDNGRHYDVDNNGCYFCSSPADIRIYYMYFYNGDHGLYFNARWKGYSVRPVINPSNTLHKVSVTGDYNDLSNKPTIPAAVAVKGNAESSYRTGNVNITPANIGLGNVDNTADADKSVAYASVAGSAPAHSYIVPEGDNRNVSTHPTDYTNDLIFRGLKNSNIIDYPSSDDYQYLFGLKGWSDSSGGKAWEIAFNNSGINVRNGGDNLSWGSWYKLATTSDIPTSLPANGGNADTVDGYHYNNLPYLPTSGGSITSGLDILAGSNLALIASSNNPGDPGDLIFANSSGEELMRIYNSSNDAFIRFGANDSSKTILNSGNWSNFITIPTTLPASDIYSWAKAENKPSYTASEVGISSSVQPITSNTSSSCSITGSSNDGKSQTIIYTNSTSSDLTVTVPTTYKTPDGAAIELTCKAGGYCEVNYLNIGGTIYARGL